MEFLRVAFSLFLRGEERQGSVKKRKKIDCGDAASIEKETIKVRNRGKRKKRSALIYFFIFFSYLLLFFFFFFFTDTLRIVESSYVFDSIDLTLHESSVIKFTRV